MSEVMHRALREAIRLAHPSAGPAHVVLALLDREHLSVAQEVLVAVGVDKERVEAAAARQYRRRRGDPSPAPAGSTAEPLWHETAGRAEGFAATLGGGAGDAELVLLALLWQPVHRWFADLLASAGTTREAVVDALAQRGVPLPRRPPPPLPPPMTQAAVFPKDRVNDVNWALRARDPALRWGLGSDPDDQEAGVVLAAADVDLAGVLDDVVGAGGWRWRPRKHEDGAG